MQQNFFNPSIINFGAYTWVKKVNEGCSVVKELECEELHFNTKHGIIQCWKRSYSYISWCFLNMNVL